MSKIWYDADTLLEEVLDTMPDDIQALFDNPAYVTETDLDESWKDAELAADADFQERITEWFANRCCPDAVTAARRLCGCRGSGEMPADIAEYLARNGA